MNSRRVNPILRRNPSGNPGASFSYARRKTFGNPPKKS
jgi:hypothetical protein